MKASHKPQQRATPRPFEPRPLTLEQLNAIDLLIQGKTDQEAADLTGKDRATIWKWKHHVPLFAATLEQRREEVFGVALHRLRNLLSKALDNISGAIHDGDMKASFELLKATGLHGFCPPTGETDVGKIAERICLEQLSKESIPQSTYDLIDVGKNPRYEERKREILEELGRGDLMS